MTIFLQGTLMNIFATRQEVSEFAKCFSRDGARLAGVVRTQRSPDENYLKAVRFEVREGQKLTIEVKGDETVISADKLNLEAISSNRIERFWREAPIDTDLHLEYFEGCPMFEGSSLSLVILMTDDPWKS